MTNTKLLLINCMVTQRPLTTSQCYNIIWIFHQYKTQAVCKDTQENDLGINLQVS